MTNSVLLIVLVALVQASFAVPPPPPPPERPEHLCLAIEDVSEEEAASIIHTKIPSVEDQKNDKLKCYAACVLEEMNIINGCTFQLDLAKQTADARRNNELSEAFDVCVDSVKGNERCECGYNLYKCITDYFISLRGQPKPHHA